MLSKKIFLLIIALLFMRNCCLCQNNLIGDSLKIISLIDSAKANIEIFNLEKANSFIRNAKAKSVQIRNNNLFYKSLFLHGIITENKGDYHGAINFYNDALKYYLTIKSEANIGELYGAIGLCYSKKGNYPEALDYFFKALKIQEKLKDDNQIATTYANISIVFWGQEQFDTALKYLKKSTVLRYKQNDKSGIAYNYGNEALFYSSKNENEKAISTYLKTISLCNDLNDINCLASAYNNLGELILEKGDAKTALIYQRKALEYRTKMQDHNGIGTSLVNIGKAFYSQNKLDSAKISALEGLEYAEETDSWEDLKDGAEILSKIHEVNGDSKNALYYFKIYSNAKDSLFNTLNTEQITLARMNYEFEQKQQKQLLEEQKTINQLSQNKAQRNLFFILLLSSLILVFIIYGSYKNSKKNNEKLISNNNKLTELNIEKDSLTKIVAHDLKTPMGQVKGLAQLMDMLGPLNNEQKEVIEKMNKSVNYGNKLIENLLNINKLEDANLIVELKLLSLDELLNAALNHLQTSAKIKNIIIEEKLNYKGNILTNKEYFIEIIENLLSNAIKFTNGGRKIQIISSEDEQFVMIQIKDEGPGFSIDDRERLFKKYQKLSARPTGGERSTGLGLYIVKLLADKINLKITLETIQYKGSTFILTIKK